MKAVMRAETILDPPLISSYLSLSRKALRSPPLLFSKIKERNYPNTSKEEKGPIESESRNIPRIREPRSDPL
jgi:hypothetical protein